MEPGSTPRATYNKKLRWSRLQKNSNPTPSNFPDLSALTVGPLSRHLFQRDWHVV
jgi:hypothetical protein